MFQLPQFLSLKLNRTAEQYLIPHLSTTCVKCFQTGSWGDHRAHLIGIFFPFLIDPSQCVLTIWNIYFINSVQISGFLLSKVKLDFSVLSKSWNSALSAEFCILFFSLSLFLNIFHAFQKFSFEWLENSFSSGYTIIYIRIPHNLHKNIGPNCSTLILMHIFKNYFHKIKWNYVKRSRYLHGSLHRLWNCHPERLF